MITQSRQLLQQEPATVFGNAEWLNGKVKVLSTHGSGTSRRTLLTLDLSGATSFIEFATGFFDLDALPAGEKEGFFMIIPINYELGKEYVFPFSANNIVSTSANIQIHLLPLATLTTGTNLDFFGWDTDAGNVLYAQYFVNLANAQVTPLGIPLYSGFSPVTVAGSLNTPIGISGRFLKGMSFRIELFNNVYDGMKFRATGAPLLYGDFN